MVLLVPFSTNQAKACTAVMKAYTTATRPSPACQPSLDPTPYEMRIAIIMSTEAKRYVRTRESLRSNSTAFGGSRGEAQRTSLPTLDEQKEPHSAGGYDHPS